MLVPSAIFVVGELSTIDVIDVLSTGRTWMHPTGFVIFAQTRRRMYVEEAIIDQSTNQQCICSSRYCGVERLPAVAYSVIVPDTLRPCQSCLPSASKLTRLLSLVPTVQMQKSALPCNSHRTCPCSVMYKSKPVKKDVHPNESNKTFFFPVPAHAAKTFD